MASVFQPQFTITNRMTHAITRRSLQRDLKGMLDKDLITAEGATNQLVYRLAG